MLRVCPYLYACVCVMVQEQAALAGAIPKLQIIVERQPLALIVGGTA